MDSIFAVGNQRMVQLPLIDIWFGTLTIKEKKVKYEIVSEVTKYICGYKNY